METAAVILPKKGLHESQLK